MFVNIQDVTACEYYIFDKSISFMFEFWSIFRLFENSLPVFCEVSFRSARIFVDISHDLSKFHMSTVPNFDKNKALITFAQYCTNKNLLLIGIVGEWRGSEV